MLRDFLYGVDANTLILICFFFIIFAFLNWILFRTFKNRSTSGIISFCIALMAVYGFNRMRWDFSGFFSGIGISENVLYGGVMILIVLFLIFLFWKLKFAGSLMVVGGLLAVASLLDLFYEKTLMLIIGGALFLLGLFIKWKKGRKALGKGLYYGGKGLGKGIYYTGKGIGKGVGAGVKYSRRQLRKMREEQKEKQKVWDDEMKKRVEAAKKNKEKEPIQQIPQQIKKQQRQQEKIQQQEQEQQQQKEVEKQKRVARKRSYKELLEKYEGYSTAIKKLQRKNNGRIPARGTPDGDLRHRYIQAMQSIENLGAQQGFSMPRDSVKLEKQGLRTEKNSRKENQKRRVELEKKYHIKEAEYNRYMQEAMQGSNSSRKKATQVASEVQAIVNEMNGLSNS